MFILGDSYPVADEYVRKRNIVAGDLGLYFFVLAERDFYNTAVIDYDRSISQGMRVDRNQHDGPDGWVEDGASPR